MSTPRNPNAVGAMVTAVDWHRCLAGGMTREQIVMTAAVMIGIALNEMRMDPDDAMADIADTIKSSAHAAPELIAARPAARTAR